MKRGTLVTHLTHLTHLQAISEFLEITSAPLEAKTAEPMVRFCEILGSSYPSEAFREPPVTACNRFPPM